MPRLFQVSEVALRGKSVWMNPELRDLLPDCRREVDLSFGAATTKALLDVSHEAAPREIVLSQEAREALRLPLHPSYELSARAGQLSLGPAVGILAAATGDSLTSRRLKGFHVYTKAYDKLHGALIVFALDGLDRSTLTTQGYCYDPRRDTWEDGVFPYPASIYRRIGLSSHWRAHLKSATGDRMFNSCVPGKWQIYRWLSGEGGAPELVPHEQVDLMKYRDRVVDFRVVAQKDEFTHWRCYAIVGRVAPEWSVVSNVSSGGAPVAGDTLLTRDLGLSQKDAFVCLERMKMAAYRVGAVLDRFMNAGTIELDLGLDTSGRLWVLEVNLRDPDHRVIRAIGDPLSYYRVKSELLLYAKSLAGFGPGDTGNVLRD